MVVHDKSSAEYVEMKVQEILTRNIAIKDRLQMIKQLLWTTKLEEIQTRL